MQLRRIDGRWRVDLSEPLRDRSARLAAENAGAAARIAEEMTREIAEGKYQTAQEAAAAFRARRQAERGQ